ncbi:MAG TPA: GlmU family protein [Salinimicrobium sp.]|nr:GlmU family protein [Salinimicrobium sp.]
MNYILFDGPVRDALLPFTFTRPVADLRIGILTIREKWEKHLRSEISTLTEDYLSRKWPLVESQENIMISASFLPTAQLVKQVVNLGPGEAIFEGEEPVAYYCGEVRNNDLSRHKVLQAHGEIFRIQNTWDIFSKNAESISADFELLTSGRESQEIPSSNQIIAPENIFIEEGADVQYAILNASAGPIYIGKDSRIMEGSLIRGPFALCENGTVKMGTKIYGATTIGPFCMAGGEIKNSVFFGYTNKSHEGYLGNSVLGEWCNIGADTNSSNLKNNYAQVKLWDYQKQGFKNTGLQFCGLMMGDHSKCGINTMFNTGTVVGVSANIFGAGFPRNFIPSFSWGGSGGFTTYKTVKAFEVAKIVMERRNIEFSQTERDILESVFEMTAQWRRS